MMNKNILGEQILKFRKEAGLTQEDLGKAVGVSTQAVSRWECGGTPDVELLPAIADQLHVSIDALFGREGGEAFDLKKLLYRAIQNAPRETCMEEMLAYSWIMQCAFVVNQYPEYTQMRDVLSSLQISDRTDENVPELMPDQMAINSDAGCMLQGMAADMRFCLILPENKQGYAAMLKNVEEYTRLFQLLAKPHYLDMLIDIDMRSPGEYFTAALAASKLGLTNGQAQEILNELALYQMVSKMDISDAAGKLIVYKKNEGINLHVFLFFSGQMMCSVESVNMGVNVRQKPVFTALPGSGSLIPNWKTDLAEKIENEESASLESRKLQK